MLQGRTSIQTPWVQPAQAPLVPPRLGQQPLFSERLTHTRCASQNSCPMSPDDYFTNELHQSLERVGLTPETPAPILLSTTWHMELQEKTATCPEAPRLGLAYEKRALSKDTVSALAMGQKG